MLSSLSTRGLRRVALAMVLAILLTAIPLSTVLAHAVTVRSDPADNSVLPTAPQQVRVWFSEPINAQFSQAKVIDGSGNVLAEPAVRAEPADPTLMTLAMPQLSDGVYNIAWVVLSAADGHTNEGHLVFRIGEGGASAPPASPQLAIRPPEVGLRWLDFTALAGLVGAIAVATLLLRPGVPGAQPLSVAAALAGARRRALGWAAICAASSFLVGLGVLIWQASALTFGAGIGMGTVAWRLLTGTRWGELWVDRQLITLSAGGVLYYVYKVLPSLQNSAGINSSVTDRRTSDSLPLSLPALAFAALVIQALEGHAAAITPPSLLPVAIDLVHLAATSVWVGGLLALAVALLPLALSRRGTPAFATLVEAGWRPFGALAAICVGLTFATGLYNTGREVASIDALLTTSYGRALVVKVAVVLLVGAVGLLNASLLHPRLAAPLARLLRRPRGWTLLSIRRLPLLVVCELTLGLLVLAATGALTSLAPAHGPEFALPPANVSKGSISQQADDMLVTFVAQPNVPGSNIITIGAVSTRRPAPAPILRVIVHFTNMQQPLGTTSVDAREVGAGVYQITGSQLSLTGPWQADVTVRRRGLEDSVARFDWVVGTPPRPVIVSKQPMKPVLDVAGAGLAVVVLLVAVGWWTRVRRPRNPTPTHARRSEGDTSNQQGPGGLSDRQV